MFRVNDDCVICEKWVKHDWFYVERVQSGAPGSLELVNISPLSVHIDQ